MDCYVIINQFISTILLKKNWNYQKRNSYIMIVLSKWGKWQYECRSIFDINCKKKIKKIKCTVHGKHWVFLNWFEIQANFPAVNLKLTPYTAAQTFYLPTHTCDTWTLCQTDSRGVNLCRLSDPHLYIDLINLCFTSLPSLI